MYQLSLSVQLSVIRSDISTKYISIRGPTSKGREKGGDSEGRKKGRERTSSSGSVYSEGKNVEMTLLTHAASGVDKAG